MVTKARRGFLLVEILMALAALAGVGLALFSMLSAGTSGASRAAASHAAALVLARVGDRLAAAGHMQLSALRGSLHPFTWSEAEDLRAVPALEDAVSAGGNRVFAGAYRVEALEMGLLRVTISLHWGSPGKNARDGGSLLAVRYVARGTP